MLKDMSRAQSVGVWCAVVLAIGAGSVAAGAAMTMSSVELLLVAGLVPPAIMLLVWGGPPPVTLALLHSVDTSSRKARL